MAPGPGLRRAVAYFWQGPADLPRVLRLEWRFVAIRWLGILLLAPSLLLVSLPAERLLAAYAILLVEVVYNLTVQVMIRQRPTLLVNGITMLGGSLIDIAMVSVGGGFNSPFYYILFTVTMAAAMRYGYGLSLLMVLIFIALDAIETLGIGHEFSAPFLFRSLFLLITSMLASYLREQALRAEAALEERLRQANLLNEATAMLGASLEFQPALHAVAAAACHLFGGSAAVLRPAAATTGESGPAPLIDYPAAGRLPVREALAELCRHSALGPNANAPTDGDGLPREAEAPNQEVIVLTLALPDRPESLATLALAMPPDQAVPALDPDILDSFRERATLAIENAALYRTLAARSNDLRRAYGDLALAHQELLSVDEVKTNFLANVSHELRTPLSSIRAFSELLLSHENDPKTQREFLQIINSESERLTRLVHDVLDIAKIEAGSLDWQMTTVDLASLLHDSARTYAALTAAHRLQFEQAIAPDLPPIWADPDRLQQVISNLLSNALKFTARGTIRLCARQQSDEIWVSVSDTGIGIAPEDQERIFEKFHQVGQALNDKPGGTGLGLCIARDIAQHHGGRLWVESELGQGSTFTLALKVPAPLPALPSLEMQAV